LSNIVNGIVHLRKSAEPGQRFLIVKC